MKHIQSITRQTPAKAQFEVVLQFIAMLQSILGLIDSIERVFGVEILNKDGEAAG